MMYDRRAFLKTSSLWAVGSTAPLFWQRVARAAPGANEAGGKQTVLVVVQLSGGNDGLNTIVPFRDAEYAKARPKLKLAADRVLKINDEVAFHPGLKGCAKLLEESRLAIIQGVGYPEPNRSHFASMDIWHKATKAEAEPFGWLGRAVDKLGSTTGAFQIGGGDLPLALGGASARAATLKSLGDFQSRLEALGDNPQKKKFIADLAVQKSGSGNPLLATVQQSARETLRSVERLRKVGEDYRTPVVYPGTGLANRLKLIAQLIDADLPERVYYTSLEGFDTHADQLGQHAQLLQELGDGLAAFQADVRHHGHGERVLCVTFSEFGRRVRENGSQGTDHGAASQMLVVGDKIKAGVVGEHPSLVDLTEGDLKFHTDFRRVYATLLDLWLGVPSAEILGPGFAPLELLKKLA